MDSGRKWYHIFGGKIGPQNYNLKYNIHLQCICWYTIGIDLNRYYCIN